MPETRHAACDARGMTLHSQDPNEKTTRARAFDATPAHLRPMDKRTRAEALPQRNPSMSMPPDRQSQSTLKIACFDRTHAWCIDIQDDAGGRRVALGEGRVVVGTSSRADVVIEDPTVSSFHCALTVVAGGIGIEDLQSKNGTYVG